MTKKTQPKKVRFSTSNNAKAPKVETPKVDPLRETLLTAEWQTKEVHVLPTDLYNRLVTQYGSSEVISAIKAFGKDDIEEGEFIFGKVYGLIAKSE